LTPYLSNGAVLGAADVDTLPSWRDAFLVAAFASPLHALHALLELARHDAANFFEALDGPFCREPGKSEAERMAHALPSVRLLDCVK
jgi:hypothetical protein